MLFKKSIIFLCLLAFVALSSVYVEAADKPAVAVIPFSNQSARKGNPSIESAIKETYYDVATYIDQTGRFKTLTRDLDEMEKMLTNMGWEHDSGLFDSSTIAQYGKMLGARYLVLGTLTGVGKRGNEFFANLSLRMINVETAEIYLSGRGKGKSRSDEIDALEKATKDALKGEMGMFKGK